MNILASSQYLLTFFPPEERSIPDNASYPGRNAAVLKALNDAFQDLFGKGKPWMRQDERGALLHPPTLVPITVTQGSTEATISEANWQARFSGCSIVIAGSATDNQIRNDSATVRLKYPHDGPSGETTATIYQDSLDLDEDILEVHGPVRLNRLPLTPITSPYNYGRGIPTEDFGFHLASPRPHVVASRVADLAEIPRGYTVDTWSENAEAPPRVRIRLFPAPLTPASLDYSAMLAPPRITNLSSTAALPVPFGHVESIFLPIAVKKLRGSPFWRGIVADQEVNDGYATALSLLADANPKKTSGIRLRPQF
jgi:hypothetical protein